MKPSMSWKWPSLVAGGVSIAVLALAGCRPESTSTSNVPAAPSTNGTAIVQQDTPPDNQPIPGKKPMPAAPASEKVLHASEENFNALVLQSSEPVLVDFYADWCYPCRQLAPVLEELAGELRGAKVVKVNIDNSPNLAKRYGVESIPNVQVFKKGAVHGQIVGLTGKEQLRALIER